jgi:pimeloyl-ACP methyl ester carboxylesterase
MGGYVAAAYAAAHPGHVAGVVLGACAHDTHTRAWKLLGHVSEFVYRLCSYRTKAGFIYRWGLGGDGDYGNHGNLQLDVASPIPATSAMYILVSALSAPPDRHNFWIQHAKRCRSASCVQVLSLTPGAMSGGCGRSSVM